MASVALAFLPIWVITALGWGTSRAGWLGDQAGELLGRFVFTIAMPALLFTTLSTVPIGRVANVGVLAFAVSTLAVGAIGLLVSRWVFRRKLAEQAISAMAAAYVNSANLGIPVAVQVLGDTSFVIAAALFQMLLITPLILLLIDIGQHSDSAGSTGLWRRVMLLPFRNPIIAASAVGVTIASLGWHVPTALSKPLELLGGAAVPVALFSLGMSLHTKRSREGTAEVGALVLLKVIAQPVLAYLAGRYLFGLDGPLLFALVLCAGLPTAQNAFIFATEYKLPTEQPRDAIVFSTLLSMLSLSVITWLLG